MATYHLFGERGNIRLNILSDFYLLGSEKRSRVVNVLECLYIYNEHRERKCVMVTILYF